MKREGLADGDELSFVSAVLHASDIGHPVRRGLRGMDKQPAAEARNLESCWLFFLF